MPSLQVMGLLAIGVSVFLLRDLVYAIVTQCYSCHGDNTSECAFGAPSDICKIADNYSQCIAYRYLNAQDRQVWTYLGCGNKKITCDVLNKNFNTTICNECSENLCNIGVGDTTEKTLCIQYSGKDSKNVALTKDTICTLDKTKKACLAYSYFNVTAKKLWTYKGCINNENQCQKLDSISNTTICSTCRDTTICNDDFGQENAKTLCIKCSGEECTNGTLSDATTFCKLDGQTNKECIAYQYLNDDKISTSTYRGCTSEINSCSNMYSNTTICKTCKDDNICNIDFKNATEETVCMECSGEDGGYCANGVINKSIKLCNFDKTSKSACIAYKYLNITDGKLWTYRGCTNDTNKCEALKATSYMTVCYTCKNNIFCNKNFGDEAQKTLCIQCSGKNCKDDVISLNNNSTFCQLEDTQSKKCIAYKYKAGNNVTITARGCASKDDCKSMYKGKYNQTLQMCNECDGTICNRNVDTNQKHKTCIECDDKEGSICAAQIVFTAAVGRCVLDDTVHTNCEVHKYISEGTVRTHRSCVPEKDCEALNKISNTTACQTCSNGTNCNKNINITDEKTLCIKCTSLDRDCNEENMNKNTIKEYCALDNNKECIVYKYLNGTDHNSVIVRDCVDFAKVNCTVLQLDINRSSNVALENCYECREGNLCNKNLNAAVTTESPIETTTARAPPSSVKTFGVTHVGLFSIIFVSFRL